LYTYMNIFRTIVHQTLLDKGNADQIENEGPFPVQDVKNSYLGGGYYFWDNHIELAHWWGKVHCANKYVICQGDLEVTEDLFFDLLGSREQQLYFKDVISKLPGAEHMPIGSVIELLKELEGKPNKKGIFPFKVIRAMDVKNNSFKQNVIPFAKKKVGEMTLAPQIIVCLIEKNNLHLRSYKIIHPDKYI
jgi:hypothetical protein